MSYVFGLDILGGDYIGASGDVERVKKAGKRAVAAAQRIAKAKKPKVRRATQAAGAKLSKAGNRALKAGQMATSKKKPSAVKPTAAVSKPAPKLPGAGATATAASAPGALSALKKAFTPEPVPVKVAPVMPSALRQAVSAPVAPVVSAPALTPVQTKAVVQAIAKPSSTSAMLKVPSAMRPAVKSIRTLVRGLEAGMPAAPVEEPAVEIDVPPEFAEQYAAIGEVVASMNEAADVAYEVAERAYNAGLQDEAAKVITIADEAYGENPIGWLTKDLASFMTVVENPLPALIPNAYNLAITIQGWSGPWLQRVKAASAEAEAALASAAPTAPVEPVVDPLVTDPLATDPYATAPFDPGTAGGGGGGGGYDSSFDSGGGGGGGSAFDFDAAEYADAGTWDESYDEGDFSQAVASFRRGVDPFDQESAVYDDGEMAVEAEPMLEAVVEQEIEHMRDAAQDEHDEALREYQRTQAGVTEDDAVLGIDFEWQDIFLPHRALQRLHAEYTKPIEEVEMKMGKAPAPRPVKMNAVASMKLKAAKQRYAEAQRRLAALEAPPAAEEGETVMGFEMDEIEDISMDKYEMQITDAEDSGERQHGSAHRGAAYLEDLTYPLGGRSNTTPATEELVFGASYGSGLDILGAGPVAMAGSRVRSNVAQSVMSAKKAGVTGPALATVAKTAAKAGAAKVQAAQPRAGIKLTKTPAGRRITTLALKKKKDPKASIKNAKDAGERAIKIGNKLAAAAKKKAVTKVHGDIFGAPQKVAPKKKGPKVSPAKLKLADKAIRVGKSAIESANKFGKVVKSNEASLKAGVTKVKRWTDKGTSGGTSIRGDEVQHILGAFAEAVGEDMWLDHVADQQAEEIFGAVAPGYTGAMDEEYVDDPAMAEEYGAYSPGPVPTAGTLPPLVPGEDFVQDPGYQSDKNVYSSDASVPGASPIPFGAVFYDGTEPLPWMGVGSYTRFHGGAPEDRGGGNSGYQWGGGNAKIMDGWYLFWQKAYNVGGVDLRLKKEGEGEHHVQGTGPKRSDSSVSGGWGALIGNPDGWTKGLRYDVGGNRWFWYRDNAPSWATRAEDLQRLNQALTDYKAEVAAAEAEAAAQVLADQADAAEEAVIVKQQAREDADFQRQLDRETQMAEHQAAIQTIQDERQAARAESAPGDEQAALWYMQAQEEEQLHHLEQGEAEYQEAQPSYDAEAEQYAEQYADGAEEYVDAKDMLDEMPI